MKRSKSPKGFSLIELMIGVSLGLFVVTSILTLSANFSKQHRLHDAMSSVQYNGSHASRMVTHALQYAGFQGCQIQEIGIQDSDFGAAENTVATELIGTPNNDFPISDFDTETFLAFDYGAGGTPTPTPPSLISAALNNLNPAPRNNSTVLVSYSVSNEFIRAISNLSDEDADIPIQANTLQLAQDSYAFITDCFAGTIFRVKNDPTTAIEHDTFSFAYREDAEVRRVNFDITYVGQTNYNNSDGKPVYALYRSRNGEVRQLAEGVNLMKVEFKMPNAADGSMVYRAPSDAGFDISLVTGARVALMVTSLTSPLHETDTRSYTLLGDSYGPGDLSGEFATKGYKQVFTTSAMMRNLRLQN